MAGSSRGEHPGSRAPILSTAALALVVAATVLAQPQGATAVDVGQQAPALDLQDLSGQGVTLSALRGRVVVIDFWASWCTPCLDAMPDMAALHNELSARGLTVLAVSIDEEAASARRAVEGRALPFSVLLDPSQAVAGAYGVEDRLPATIVVDREGIVRFVQIGSRVDASRLRTTALSLL